MATRKPTIHSAHSAAHRQRSVQDLLHEHPEGARIRLGPVTFRLNPSSYQQTSERVVVQIVSAGGVGRYDYGSKAREYQISVSTGLAGVYGPGGVQDLRQFEPEPGKPDRLWPLVFPGEFRGTRWVKVTQFKLSRDAGSQFFHTLDMTLQEYPKGLLVSAATVPSTVLPSPLPVSG